jgi:hypothetical protein
VRSTLLLLIALLYLASVPWYRDANAAPSTIFGLPDWVFVAIACYAAVSLLNAAAWMLTDLRDDVTPGDGDES